MLRFPFLLLFTLHSVAPVFAAERPSARYKVAEVSDSFDSGGVRVQTLRFEPIGVDNKCPAVVMLHGSDGWGQMKAYRFVGQDLAAQGHVAILIRYFDRTDTPDEIPADQRAEFLRWLEGKAIREKDHPARQCFEEWVTTVGDAAAYARRLNQVDERRIGLAGFSLGGFLAVSAAAREQFGFAALVEMFGGVPVEHRNRVRSLPPALIVHGEEDEVVSVREADALVGLLTRHKQLVEVEIYPRAGHAFLVPGTEIPNPRLMLAGRDRMTAFFNKYLRSPLHETLKTR